MTNGLLLDSHLLTWLDQRVALKGEAEFGIAEAGHAGKLFVSHISVWELGVAIHKRNFERRPNLRELSIEAWYQQVCDALDAHEAVISKAVALEAAKVPGVYGSGDPGDCFLIATARVNGLVLATRDAKILELAERRPDYLSVLAC